jgi:hypothetical protein
MEEEHQECMVVVLEVKEVACGLIGALGAALAKWTHREFSVLPVEAEVRGLKYLIKSAQEVQQAEVGEAVQPAVLLVRTNFWEHLNMGLTTPEVEAVEGHLCFIVRKL